MQQQVAAVEYDRNGTIIVDEKLHRSGALEENILDLLQYGSEHAPLIALVKDLQAEIWALKKKRVEEGKANEKVVSIFASREQAWKAERRRLLNERKRLWLELRKAFMEQEVLRRRTQHLAGVQRGGDFEYVCEECEQQEEWLVEMKERLHEQEFVIMATTEEVKAEQQEKNSLIAKMSKLEGDLCEVNEKLRLEVEARSYDAGRHASTLAELDVSYKQIEMDKAQALQEIENLQSRLASISQERNHYEDLVVEMSSEIHSLQTTVQEKEDIISAMLKKADAEVEEKHELERELVNFRNNASHGQIEEKKWQKHVGNSSPPRMGIELMKSRRSFGNKTDSRFDKMRELQRLHEAEVQDLQAAFEGEVRLLKKKLSIFQQRVADLEENMLLRISKNEHGPDGFYSTNAFNHHGEHNKGMTVSNDCKEGNTKALLFQLSVLKTLLRRYSTTDGQKEQEIERWKKAYFASKATIDMLQEERGYTVPSPKSRGLGDWLEVERARSKLEQRHLQEISAFERQLKARDERLEAFRQQLLAMENEAMTREVQIESLRRELQIAVEKNPVNQS